MHRVSRLSGMMVLIVWGVSACATAQGQAPGSGNAKEPWDWFKAQVRGFVGEPLDPHRPSLPPAYPGAAKRLEARNKQVNMAPSRRPSSWQPQQDPTLEAIKEWVGEPFGRRPRQGAAAPQSTPAEPTRQETTAGFEHLEEPGETVDQADSRTGNPAWTTIKEWVGEPPDPRAGGRNMKRRPSRVRPASATYQREMRPQSQHGDPTLTTIKRWVGKPLDPYGPRRSRTQSHPRGRTPRPAQARLAATPQDYRSPRLSDPRGEHEPIEDRRVISAEDASSEHGEAELPDHLTIMREIFHGSPSSSASSRSLGHSRRAKPPRR